MTIHVKNMCGNHTEAKFIDFPALQARCEDIIDISHKKYFAQVVQNNNTIEIILFDDNSCRQLIKAIAEMI